MDFLISNLARDQYDDDRAQKAVAAIQRVLSSDFAATDSTPLVLHYVKDRPLADTEPGLVFDPRDDDNYLGEHHLDKVPRAVVLIGACKKYGEDPDETCSHEIFETAGDLSGKLEVEIDDIGTVEAWEECDAVQGTPRNIDGVSIANFVYPLAYFCEVGTQYDWNKALAAPHTKTSGGYRLLKKPGQQWTQDEGEKIVEHKKLHMAPSWSRRGRRVQRQHHSLTQANRPLQQLHALAEEMVDTIARMRGITP